MRATRLLLDIKNSKIQFRKLKLRLGDCQGNHMTPHTAIYQAVTESIQLVMTIWNFIIIMLASIGLIGPLWSHATVHLIFPTGLYNLKFGEVFFFLVWYILWFSIGISSHLQSTAFYTLHSHCLISFNSSIFLDYVWFKNLVNNSHCFVIIVIFIILIYF